MFPDQIALLSVTAMAKKVGGSALPNAPVVDDANDQSSLRVRIAAVRSWLSEAYQPGERVASMAPCRQPETVPGC